LENPEEDKKSTSPTSYDPDLPIPNNFRVTVDCDPLEERSVQQIWGSVLPLEHFIRHGEPDGEGGLFVAGHAPALAASIAAFKSDGPVVRLHAMRILDE
jgi:hypothetical protein